MRAGRLAVDCRLWAGQRKAHRSRAAHPSCCPCAVCRSSSGKSPGSRIPNDDAACTATAAQAGARLPCSLLQKSKQPHICGTRQRHVAHVPYLSALCTAPPPHIAALCTAPPPHIAARCAPAISSPHLPLSFFSFRCGLYTRFPGWGGSHHHHEKVCACVECWD